MNIGQDSRRRPTTGVDSSTECWTVSFVDVQNHRGAFTASNDDGSYPGERSRRDHLPPPVDVTARVWVLQCGQVHSGLSSIIHRIHK